MPMVQNLWNGQPFGRPVRVADASEYLGDPNYQVSADGDAGSSAGIGYDPRITQRQWELEYLRQAAEGQAKAATDQYTAQTGRYGAQTTRAGTIGQLYADLFGKPENLAATANLMRGQPNASPLSFYGALGNLGPLGQAPDFAGMKTRDAGAVIGDLVGAAGKAATSVGAGGGDGGGGGGKGQSRYEQRRDAIVKAAGLRTHDEYQQKYGIRAEELNRAAKRESERTKLKEKLGGGAGLAAGGSVFVDHPAEIVFASGKRIPIGEYGRPERIDVTPLSDTPLPPRYYEGLAARMAEMQPGFDPVPSGRGFAAGQIPPQALFAPLAYSGPPIPDTRYVVPRMGGLGGGAQGGWSGNDGPESEQASLSPIGTVPLGAPWPPAGMAAGGSIVYGQQREPVVLYPQGQRTQATGQPNAWGQVSAPSAQGGGARVDVPYYQATPFADPTLADPRVVRRLTPLELGLLDATSKAQKGIDLNQWMALYQQARLGNANASTASGYTRPF